MTSSSLTFRNGAIFDGSRLLEGRAARFEAGLLASVCRVAEAPADGDSIDLAGDILCPGYVDLQVNGGGGVMFNDDPSVDTLQTMATAHRRLGVVSLLPTLITETPEKTRAAIAAAVEATRSRLPGIAGLHLEGPHLSLARKGAHDPDLIRPMSDDDMAALLDAAAALPVLKITVAPESVSEEQVRALSSAGLLVSLGHTDADFDTCRRYFAAGARCVTHLFNAMSQLGNRTPGLVGAALATGSVFAGLIADAVHVHPETMRTAWAAKTGPGRLFLVSDSMAVAGTDLGWFELGGRRISRRDGILTLEDGTLAGADLDLTTAVRISVERAAVPVEIALRAATSVPAGLVGLPDGRMEIGVTRLSDLLRVSHDLTHATPLMEAAYL